MQASASQQAKQGPPEVAAAESGAVEQGRAGLIMAYDPDSPLVRNLMCLLLCSCKCLSICRGLTHPSETH